MRIRKIALGNFRTYHENTIEFGAENLTVFEFVNGTGKTSLLNAISWCLHGVEVYPRPRSIPWGPALLDATSRGESVEVFVSLEVEFSNGDQAEITRKQSFFGRQDNPNHADPGDLEFSVMLSPAGSNSFKRVEDDEFWVRSRLPQRLVVHYLFDGQNLSKFFDPNSSSAIEASVLQIARVDSLSSLIGHLGKMVEDYGSAGKNSRTSKETIDKRSPKEIQQEIDDNQEHQSILEKAISDLEAEYGGSPIEAAERSKESRELLEQWTGFNNDKVKLEGSLAEIDDRLREIVAEEAPAAIALNALRELLGIFGSEPETPVSAEVISHIISTDQCVCGCDISPGSERRAHLEALLEQAKLSGNISREGYELARLAREQIEVGQSFETNFSGRLKQQELDKTALSQAKKKLSSFEDRLPRSVKDLQSEQRDALELVQVASDYARTKQSIEELRKKIGELQTELNAARRHLLDQEAADAATKEKLAFGRFAQECLDTASDIYDKSIESVRKELGSFVDTFYRQIVPADYANTIESVFIDEQFVARVKSKSGFLWDESDSAGYNLLLALSFSFALGALAGFEMPIIIDTPYANLDEGNRKRVSAAIARVIKEDPLVAGRQVIFLMTDSEFTPEVSDAFSKHERFSLWQGKRDFESELISTEKVY